MTSAPLTAHDYYRTALVVLGNCGSDSLTIAELCERLGITKGSFYHHFGSMAGFVTGLLGYWEQEHNERLIAASERELDPGLRILTLTEFGITLPHAPEAAIRAWAHNNAEVAAAVARVDARRDATIADAIAGVGVDPGRARTLSRLALTVLVGVQNRERDPEPARVRALFDEVIRLVFLEADPARLERARAALGG